MPVLIYFLIKPIMDNQDWASMRGFDRSQLAVRSVRWQSVLECSKPEETQRIKESKNRLDVIECAAQTVRTVQSKHCNEAHRSIACSLKCRLFRWFKCSRTDPDCELCLRIQVIRIPPAKLADEQAPLNGARWQQSSTSRTNLCSLI